MEKRGSREYQSFVAKKEHKNGRRVDCGIKVTRSGLMVKGREMVKGSIPARTSLSKKTLEVCLFLVILYCTVW